MRESLEGGRIKGGILHAHLHWAEERRLPGGIEALRARVSQDTSRLLEAPVLPISWYPFRALIETDRAIAAAAGGDERETAVELGRHSARVNLTSGYRFYNKRQPHEFFAGVARIHPQYQDFGREEYEGVGPSSGCVSLLDSTCYSKIYCWSALGYYEQATALQGGRDPKVTELECLCDGSPRCRFQIEWS